MYLIGLANTVTTICHNALRVFVIYDNEGEVAMTIIMHMHMHAQFYYHM